jgi:hypothetical protein
VNLIVLARFVILPDSYRMALSHTVAQTYLRNQVETGSDPTKLRIRLGLCSGGKHLVGIDNPLKRERTLTQTVCAVLFARCSKITHDNGGEPQHD